MAQKKQHSAKKKTGAKKMTDPQASPPNDTNQTDTTAKQGSSTGKPGPLKPPDKTKTTSATTDVGSTPKDVPAIPQNIKDLFTLTSDAPTDGTPVAPGTAVNLVASGDADFTMLDHQRGVLTPDPNEATKAVYTPSGEGTNTITATSRSAGALKASIQIVSSETNQSKTGDSSKSSDSTKTGT